MFQRHLGALALAVALIAPLAASAQTAPAPAPAMGAPVAPGAESQPRHHHHHRNGFMHAMRGLNLSDAQKQQLAGIFKSARDKRQQVAAGTKPDPATRHANMVAMRAQIDAILTDTQRAQLADNLKRERQQKRESRAPQATPQ